MPMTKANARKLLQDTGTRLARPNGAALSPEERRERSVARSRAQRRAYVALSHAHPDEYRLLYATAVAEEIAKLGSDGHP